MSPSLNNIQYSFVFFKTALSFNVTAKYLFMDIYLSIYIYIHINKILLIVNFQRFLCRLAIHLQSKSKHSFRVVFIV